MIRTTTRSASSLIFVVLVSGCVNLQAVGKFADHTQTLAQASKEFYALQLTTDRNLAEATVDLSTPWSSIGFDNLAAESRAKYAAVRALATYADGLKAIATVDEDDEVRDASTKLAGNLNSLATVLNAGTVNESVVGTAVTAIAQIYIRIQQRRVVLDAVRQAQPYVDEVLDSLVEDATREAQRQRVARAASDAARDTWYEGLASNAASQSRAERARREILASKLIVEELEERAAAQQSATFVAQLQKSAVACKRAHAAIELEGLKANAIALVEFGQEVKSLVSSVNDARASGS